MGYYNSQSALVEQLNIKIDAIMVLKFGKPYIYKINYKNKSYKIQKVGLKHTERQGNIIFHIFGLVSNNTYFKVALNSKTLNCYLIEHQVIN